MRVKKEESRSHYYKGSVSQAVWHIYTVDVLPIEVAYLRKASEALKIKSDFSRLFSLSCNAKPSFAAFNKSFKLINCKIICKAATSLKLSCNNATFLLSLKFSIYSITKIFQKVKIFLYRILGRHNSNSRK